MTNKSHDGVALVTGASSGIGRSFARRLAADGYDVVIVARREARLNELKQELESKHRVSIYPLPKDLSRREAPREIVQFLQDQGLSVEYLVNNAGYTDVGLYCDLTWEQRLAFVQTMGIATLELCHALMPSMLDQGYGRIINVCSTAAYLSGMPNQTLYAPVKSMVLKFTQSIAQEYENSGVHCTAAIPGFTDTEIFASARLEKAVSKSRLMQLIMMSPETFVDASCKACEAGRIVVIPGWQNKLWTALGAHGPSVLRYKLSKLAVGLERDP